MNRSFGATLASVALLACLLVGCDTGAGYYEPCTDSGDCRSEMSCSATLGSICAPACLIDAECGSLASPAHCINDQVCARTCDADEACGDGEQCVEDACVAGGA